jgi:hypothetical protein
MCGKRELPHEHRVAAEERGELAVGLAPGSNVRRVTAAAAFGPTGAASRVDRCRR